MGLLGHVQDFNRRLKENREALVSKRQNKKANSGMLNPMELKFNTTPLSEQRKAEIHKQSKKNRLYSQVKIGLATITVLLILWFGLQMFFSL